MVGSPIYNAGQAIFDSENQDWSDIPGTWMRNTAGGYGYLSQDQKNAYDAIKNMDNNALWTDEGAAALKNQIEMSQYRDPIMDMVEPEAKTLATDKWNTGAFDEYGIDISQDAPPTGTYVAEKEDEIYEPPEPPSPPTGTDRPGGYKRDDSGPSPNEAAGQAAEAAQRAAIRDAAKTGMTVNQAKKSVGMPANLGDTGGGDSGSNAGKIVCTMMNESYGFGSFRNKIWMKFHKDLSPEYQKGYHKLFLPLVKIAKTNKVVKKVLEHIAVHSTIDMRQATRGKKHLLGRVYRKILLPICYIVGKYAKK